MAHQHRMTTEKKDEFQIVQQYHDDEKAQLIADGDALISMINYMKLRPENAHKISEISNNILNVKDIL